VSARRGSASALANALPQLFGTLPTGVLANAVAIALPQPRGLTPSPLVSVAGEWESNRLSKRCFVNHGGAYAPRSCFARGWPPAELRLLRCTNAHARGAAGVSPPWFWRRTCTRASAIVRQTAAGELAHAVAIAFVEPRGTHAPRSWSRASGSRVRTCAESSSQARLPQPRGAYAPPLLVSRRSSADGIATFAMHKRTRTRRAGVSPPWLRYRLRNNDSPDIRTSPSRPGSGAAGVSPPWFWRRTCTRASAIVRQTADRCVGARRCNRDRVITGGLRPPLLVSRASGGAVRTCAESSWQARFPNHGGLTPPALGPAGVRASQKSQFLR